MSIAHPTDRAPEVIKHAKLTLENRLKDYEREKLQLEGKISAMKDMIYRTNQLFDLFKPAEESKK